MEGYGTGFEKYGFALGILAIEMFRRCNVPKEFLGNARLKNAVPN